ncbi:putative dtdp-glucose 4-6-dehydratase [Schistosoma mansoni]|uniref:UDP-glucuronate decarboxylase n=1 Tax=Schistosoma mansoni TaxID=6183 RepID=G4VD20_SCHMA|nr:putative dtdp-glucose 4-6-dehydratase [Schistosoma mansoni]|eukprot:XP_018650414.1 putative dtdp-glucose 4-6-dehydratase [Schistosoma mansoni]
MSSKAREVLVILVTALIYFSVVDCDTCPADNFANALVADQPSCAKKWLPVKQLHWTKKKRILVTGGAGFVGSHLVDKLMQDGHEVIALDNFFTGKRHNIEHWVGHSNFELLHHDVTNPIYVEVDEIYHLASPASPQHYMHNPIRTIKANTLGTLNMLGLARRTNAKFLFASTSEIYGDPEVHPQPESYWGNVNPIGPRACYDESKRLGETMTYAYFRHLNLPVRVARIFNTYGPRMQINDGRVVTNFIAQALNNESITVYGLGEQTRSFQYISDLVNGLVALMESNYTMPVNLGNPVEFTVNELAIMVKNFTDSKSDIIYQPLPIDDPQRRQPDIGIAIKQLNWKPTVTLQEGLSKTIIYFKDILKPSSECDMH